MLLLKLVIDRAAAGLEVLAEILLDERHVRVHGMVPDTVSTWGERITGETPEAICHFTRERHFFVQLSIRVEVHHGVDMVEGGFGWHPRDDVIIIDKSEVSGCERCVVGGGEQAVTSPWLTEGGLCESLLEEV